MDSAASARPHPPGTTSAARLLVPGCLGFLRVSILLRPIGAVWSRRHPRLLAEVAPR